MTPQIGSLFSGYGGLDLAVESVTGAKPAWFVEFDKAPSKILAHHWPDVPNHGDVTKVDWEAMPRVDILTGGYPCQPFSQAGHRKGTHDERHLWPHVLNAIRVLRPRFAFLENVPGHLTLGFDQVLRDLAQIGWDAEWGTLRASDIGAPHHRERLFIFAYPSSVGLEAWRFAVGETPAKPIASECELPLPPNSSWGKYEPAIARWESMTRPAPTPAVPNSNGNKHLNSAFVEWMMGLPAGWVTSPEIGLSRTQQLKAIGNGVCPQQAEMALRELLKRGSIFLFRKDPQHVLYL